MVEKLVASGHGKKKTFYSVTEERTGSEDNILDDREDLKGIKCTTEVTIDRTEKQAQSWTYCNDFGGYDDDLSKMMFVDCAGRM